MEKRRKFQGVLNILSFNRHFYFAGLAGLILLFMAFVFYRHPILVWIIIAFLYGLTIPLLVSAYVYDFAGYYHFKWLDDQVRDTNEVRQIVSINAGFDETSFLIHNRFPGADLKVFDFYDMKRHTEPAIKRARMVSMTYPGTQAISSGSIPMNDKSADIVFLLSAAHEIRNMEERTQFLRECHRICKPGGQLIVVEHLRDLPNFMAFTVGFLHFFSKSTWKKNIRTGGFGYCRESKFTPFMSIFNSHP